MLRVGMFVQVLAALSLFDGYGAVVEAIHPETNEVTVVAWAGRIGDYETLPVTAVEEISEGKFNALVREMGEQEADWGGDPYGD